MFKHDASLSEYPVNRTYRTGEEQDLVGFDMLNHYTILILSGLSCCTTRIFHSNVEVTCLRRKFRLEKDRRVLVIAPGTPVLLLMEDCDIQEEEGAVLVIYAEVWYVLTSVDQLITDSLLISQK